MYQRLLLPLLAIVLTACDWGPVRVTEYPGSGAPPDGLVGKVVFLAGRDSHGPGAHEHKAGSDLLATTLQQQHPGISTVVVHRGWPEDESILLDSDALVLYCDGGKGHLINEHLESFNKLIAQGVGVVALHYCVEVPRGSDSAAALTAAIGGYFETDWSVNPHWEANYTTLPEHPVTDGVRPFTLLDEWYFNMRFSPIGVTPILSAIAPAHTMARSNGAHSGNDAVRELVAREVPQVTAWAYERKNGGRGFGFTGGHFHENWQNADARNLVVNAIVWSSRISEQPMTK